MTNAELKQYRTKLFRDAIGYKVKPERVPHMSFFVTWKILDAGYKLTEAMNNYDIMEKVCRLHQEKYNFDAIFELGGRNAIRFPMTLGGLTYRIDDEAESVSYMDKALIEIDEVDEYLADPNKFMWEKGMAKKYSSWTDGTFSVDLMQKAIAENNAFIGYYMRILKVMDEEYGMPSMTAPSGFCYCGLDFMFNTIFGIKNLSLLMRRKADKVDEVIKVLNSTMFDPGLAQIKASAPGPNMGFCEDYDLTLLCHTITNPKQFERWLWPDLKRVLDAYDDLDKSGRLFMEGSSKAFWDYFKDYKKGTICYHTETDDVFELRKELPNCSILGGFPIQLLGTGTPEQCVDYAKKLIDELGGLEGGFIMSQDKMVSYRNDATPENTIALCNFVREYRG